MELEKYRPSMPIEVLHSWADDAQKEIESLRAQLAKVTQDLDTAKGLLVEGRYLELYREGEEQKQQLLATQAHAMQLKTAAQELYDEFWRTREWGCVPLVLVRTKAALSTPINLDALHEHDAQVLDDAAKVSALSSEGAANAIRVMAEAYRAKKEGK